MVVRVLRRVFHTTSGRPVWWLATPLARVAVAIGARFGRKAWGRMGAGQKEAIKASLRMRAGYILAGGAAVTSCGIGYYAYHVEKAPVTGRRRLMIVNRQKIVDMMNQDKDALVSAVTMERPLLPPSHSAFNVVIPILQRIIPTLRKHWEGEADIAGVKWTLYILDSPDIANAVCLPSGDIYIHSGLLNVCQNQDELAFILSHEVAHVLLNHGAEAFSNQGVLDFLRLFVIGAIWFIVPNDLVAVFLHSWSRSLSDLLVGLPHSRLMEEEADKVGLMLLSRACFEPRKSVEIWNHFPSQEIQQYLSTHPLNEYRLEKLWGHLPLAKELWDNSQCHKLQVEATDFKKMAFTIR